jgi:hypothetical protein
LIFRHPYCFCSGTGAVLFSTIFFLQSAVLPSRIPCMPGILARNCKKRSKTFMLSTLISLYKLLGTGDFVKVLLILLKGLFG